MDRSLPDAELSEFVKTLSHRIASFPVPALEAIKQRVNVITLKSIDAVRSDAAIFMDLAKSKEASARLAFLASYGFDKRDGDGELTFGRVLGELGD